MGQPSPMSSLWMVGTPAGSELSETPRRAARCRYRLAEENVLPRVPEIVAGRQMAWGIQALLANRGEVDPKA